MSRPRQFAISVFVLGTLAIATACGGAQNNPKDARGASVRTWKGDPPADCKELGIVEAGAEGGCNVACQTKRMKDAAAELGANSLRIDFTSGGSAASGAAFNCPGQPSLASASQADKASESEDSEPETETSDTSDHETKTSDTADREEPASDDADADAPEP